MLKNNSEISKFTFGPHNLLEPGHKRSLHAAKQDKAKISVYVKEAGIEINMAANAFFI